MGSDFKEIPPRWEIALPKVNMEIMEIKAENCSAKTQVKVAAVERVLGMALPDCAEVKATPEGGILATSTDAVGTRMVVEVDNKGDVYLSRRCGEGVNSFQSVDYYTTGRDKIIYDSCKINHVRQQESVSPAKLAKARALILILGSKKTPK